MKFDELCEAYEVISNGKLQNDHIIHKLTVFITVVELRAIYDKFGEYGLKEGVVLPDGTKCGGGYFC